MVSSGNGVSSGNVAADKLNVNNTVNNFKISRRMLTASRLYKPACAISHRTTLHYSSADFQQFGKMPVFSPKMYDREFGNRFDHNSVGHSGYYRINPARCSFLVHRQFIRSGTLSRTRGGHNILCEPLRSYGSNGNGFGTPHGITVFVLSAEINRHQGYW